MSKKFRVFATCDIGESIDRLRKRGYEVEVYPRPEAPPKIIPMESELDMGYPPVPADLSSVDIIE